MFLDSYVLSYIYIYEPYMSISHIRFWLWCINISIRLIDGTYTRTRTSAQNRPGKNDNEISTRHFSQIVILYLATRWFSVITRIFVFDRREFTLLCYIFKEWFFFLYYSFSVNYILSFGLVWLWTIRVKSSLVLFIGAVYARTQRTWQSPLW